MQFKMLFQFGNQVRIFSEKFHHVQKVQAKKYHCYFVEHSISKGNNQGTKKNRIPAALKRGQNTKNTEYRILVSMANIVGKQKTRNGWEKDYAINDAQDIIM